MKTFTIAEIYAACVELGISVRDANRLRKFLQADWVTNEHQANATFLNYQVDFPADGNENANDAYKKNWLLIYERMQIYMDAKNALDKKLCEVPGGNAETIEAIYQAIDGAVIDESMQLSQLVIDSNKRI